MEAFQYQSIERGAILLCASQRLAHRLHLDYADIAQQQGKLTWPTPRILTWNAWLSDVFVHQRQRLSAVPRLLSDLQSQVIWESIVARDSKHQLLSASQAARGALRSWQLLHQYQIPVELLDRYDHEEVRVFRQWVKEFQKYTHQKHLIDAAQLPAWIRQHGYIPDRELHLTGFDHLSPSIQALLEYWRAENCHVHIDSMPCINQQTQVVALKDAEEELQMAARWARHQIEQGRRRAGVVVANLESMAPQVRRIFSGVLAPASRSVLGEFSAPVSIYASASLQSYPLIHQALHCLQLLDDKSDSNAWSQYLRSPFIAGYELEASSRALFDNALRKSGQDELSVANVAHMAAATCPVLGGLLQSLSTYKQELIDKTLPSEWIARIAKALSIAGWAQGRSLTSDEHQTREKCQEVIARLSGLDEVTGRIDFSTVRHLLANAIRQTRFAPESNESPVIVIDADTAAGMQFESLWITGIHAGDWPPPPQPDPFLPIDLQYQYQLPMASADTCLVAARKKLQRLVDSASHVVISWPQHDDVELRASALISWPTVALDAIPRSKVGTLIQVMYQSRPTLDKYLDTQLPPHPGGKVKQGSRVIELQSRCAFKAQAELRLFADSPDPAVSGIAPHDRGRFIHRVLQEVWHGLQDYNGLRLALDDENALRTRVHVIADRISQSQFAMTSSHRRKLVEIEIKVATDIVMSLLHEESRRQPFTVLRNEERELFNIAGLTLRIQPDRIDALSDGRQVLIDYKTGDSYRIKDWLDLEEPGRPRSPQLPLYSLAHAGHLSGIAYAVLAPGTAELRGLADRDGIANGISEYGKGRSRNKLPDVESWPQLLEHWQRVIHDLAEAFRQGVADVNPLKDECKYCLLAGLCRIKEQQAVELEDEDE